MRYVIITFSILDSPVSPMFRRSRLSKQEKIPQEVAVAQPSPKKAGGVLLEYLIERICI